MHRGEEGAKTISKIAVVQALLNESVRAEYFKLAGLPTDELSKKEAFSPEEVALELQVSDKSAATDKILNQEHDLILVGERSATDGINEMGKRVKTEVLGQYRSGSGSALRDRTLRLYPLTGLLPVLVSLSTIWRPPTSQCGAWFRIADTAKAAML